MNTGHTRYSVPPSVQARQAVSCACLRALPEQRGCMTLFTRYSKHLNRFLLRKRPREVTCMTMRVWACRRQKDTSGHPLRTQISLQRGLALRCRCLELWRLQYDNGENVRRRGEHDVAMICRRAARGARKWQNRSLGDRLLEQEAQRRICPIRS